MKFSEFVYKRTDVDEVRNRIREITEELKHASSLEEQIQAVYKMNEVEKEISTADSLSTSAIRSTQKRILRKRTGVQ